MQHTTPERRPPQHSASSHLLSFISTKASLCVTEIMLLHLTLHARLQGWSLCCLWLYVAQKYSTLDTTEDSGMLHGDMGGKKRVSCWKWVPGSQLFWFTSPKLPSPPLSSTSFPATECSSFTETPTYSAPSALFSSHRDMNFSQQLQEIKNSDWHVIYIYCFYGWTID